MKKEEYNKRFTKEEIELIDILVEQGKTLYKISKVINRPFNSLYRLKNSGILKSSVKFNG